MKLRYLQVRNFRGIRELDWHISQDMVCAIGAGDSTKTTILNAIAYVLWPSWTLRFSDTDFYQTDTSNAIEITAVVTELPDELIVEDKFGLWLLFWNPSEGVHAVEQAGDEIGFRVHLVVKEDLEPQWYVESSQADQQRRISASDRRRLGASQIGTYIDRDLSWSRNSALSRLTGRDSTQTIPTILADATRKVIESMENVDLGQLSQAVQDVKRAAKSIGVNPETDFRPGMDATRLSVGLGAIALLDGKIPLHLRGAGSRRLLSLAIHKEAVKEGSIILLDEIENSLEPYRLRHLIRALRSTQGTSGQVVFTTHSSVAVVECQASELCVVHSQNGTTSVNPVDESLQSIVRSVPEAFLARGIIVCEGKTEWGICRAIDEYWQRHEDSPRSPLACVGVEPVASPGGGGSEAPKYAAALAKLGYRVAYFGDSDVPLTPSKDQMQVAGITVILWDGDVEIERRLCFDLPMEGVVQFVDLAIDLRKSEGKGEDAVWDGISNELKKNLAGVSDPPPRDVLQLLSVLGDEQVLRECIGMAADHGRWFKRWDKGQKLGELLTEYLGEMQNTDTADKLKQLEEWCHA